MLCPHCRTELTRRRRPGWMRLLIGSRLYHCYNCARRYLSFIGLFKL